MTMDWRGRPAIGLLVYGSLGGALLLLPFLLHHLFHDAVLVARCLAVLALGSYFVWLATYDPWTVKPFEIQGVRKPTPPEPRRLSDGTVVEIYLSRPDGNG